MTQVRHGIGGKNSVGSNEHFLKVQKQALLLEDKPTLKISSFPVFSWHIMPLSPTKDASLLLYF